MSVSVKNQSWIGRNLKIISSTDSNQIGRNGLVFDETRETITILENDREITLVKRGIEFTIGDSDVAIVGALMRQRAEDRIYRNHRSE